MTPARIFRKPALVVLAASALFVGGGAGWALTPGHHETEKTFAHGDTALPSNTLASWIGLADYVVQFRVTGDRRGDIASADGGTSEGLQVRWVDGDVTKILWRNPLVTETPKTLSIPHGGWIASNDRPERRLFLPNSVDFEVGRTYLVPVVRYTDRTPALQALNPEDVLPMDGDIVGQGESIIGSDNKPVNALQIDKGIRGALWSKNGAAVSTFLSHATLPLGLQSTLDRPAIERYRTAFNSGLQDLYD